MYSNKNTKWRRRSWLRISLSAIAASITTGFIKKKADECSLTPMQDQGPFPVMEFRSVSDHDIDLTQIKGRNERAKGQIITVSSVVKDKSCQLITGAVVEIWQANNLGKYRHEFQDKGESDPNFQGWGQAITNEAGIYRFKTVIPGEYGNRARHIHFKISKRGYHELITQMYFSGEDRNRTDGILNRLSHEEQLLVIKPILNNTVVFDIVLQKVDSSKVSEKVLKEYTGKYLPKDISGMKEYIKSVTGKTYNEYWLTLSCKDDQLYLSMPFIATIEIGWHAKDEFQSWAYENSFIRFQRNNEGKVTALHLHFSEEQYVVFSKDKTK